MLQANFVGDVERPCLAACDVNADGDIGGVVDAVVLLTKNFIGGVDIPEPFPDCGPSEIDSDTELGCVTAGCE